MQIILLKDQFYAISSIIIFVICRSAKKYVHGDVKSMKKMLLQMFSIFEPEQCLEMGYYEFNYDRNFIIFWQMELVCIFVVFF